MMKSSAAAKYCGDINNFEAGQRAWPSILWLFDGGGEVTLRRWQNALLQARNAYEIFAGADQ